MNNLLHVTIDAFLKLQINTQVNDLTLFTIFHKAAIAVDHFAFLNCHGFVFPFLHCNMHKICMALP